MIVFDGSGSMAEMGFNLMNEPRIFEARRALAEVLPEIAANRRLGLIIYGPSKIGECAGIDLRFAPRPEAAGQIVAEVNGLQPEGNTALTDAVALAAEVLRRDVNPGAVVLITDGKETCGGSPCALASELVRTGSDITVHVIGFKVRGDHFGWGTGADNDYTQSISVARCLAERTGGEYVNTETVDDLVAALRKALGCSLLF